MIPINSMDYESGIKITTMPSRSYGISNIDEDAGITAVGGCIDGLLAVRQAIYKVLKTERNRYSIYDENYGVELNDLLGRSKIYVYAELEERIREALLRDDRISEVYDFVLSEGINKGEVYVNFKVRSSEGEDNIKMEVQV